MTARFGQSVLDAAPSYQRSEPTSVGQWIACPEPACHATAEVIDCYPLSSVDGPVPVVRTRCLGQHIRDWTDE